MVDYSNMWQDAQEFVGMFWTSAATEAEATPASGVADVEAEDGCIEAIARCYQ